MITEPTDQEKEAAEIVKKIRDLIEELADIVMMAAKMNDIERRVTNLEIEIKKQPS